METKVYLIVYQAILIETSRQQRVYRTVSVETNYKRVVC
jgi:hypothetical protein